jgi:Protein of unknown function (DUF2442)
LLSFANLGVNIMNFEMTDDQFDKGVALAGRLRQRTPLAVSAKYSQGRVHVELNNGCAVIFPAESAQGLAGASSESLKRIEVQGAGIGLHWPLLDADLHVPSLIKGVLGTRQWMRELGKAGGAAKSAKKSLASKSNGKLGGRPRKSATV